MAHKAEIAISTILANSYFDFTNNRPTLHNGNLVYVSELWNRFQGLIQDIEYNSSLFDRVLAHLERKKMKRLSSNYPTHFQDLLLI